MFGLTRWNSFDDVFNFQREVDRLFTQFWSDLPTRTAAGSSPSFHVNTTDDGWRANRSRRSTRARSAARSRRR